MRSCEYGEGPLAFDALRESEARLRSAIKASGMGTFIWRVADDCIEPDARMRSLLGLPEDRTFTRDEIISTSIHPIDRAHCANMFARAIEPAGPGSLHEEIRVTGAGGLVRWLEIKGETVFANGTASGSDGAHGRAVRMSGVATDITDRKRREADLALLDQIADSYARLSSPEEIMQVVGPLLGSYLDVPTVCLLSVDEPHDKFRMLHMWNREGSPIRPDVIRISDFVTPEYREAARSGAPLIVHDTHGDPRTYAGAHAALQVRSFMSVPFIRDGEWKFIFSVCDSRPHGWRDEEVSLFRQLADRLFARLEHALAEQAVANDLRDTQLLRDLSVRLVSESDTQAFFDAIVAAAMSITGAQGGMPSAARFREPRAGAVGGATDSTRRWPQFGRVNTTSPTSCGRALATNQRSRRPFRRSGCCRSEGAIRLLRGGRHSVGTVHATGDARRADRRHAVHLLERVSPSAVRA